MIPIQHQRKAFRYAVAFLTDEIYSIKEYLSQSHIFEHIEVALKKRLKELENDLEKLLQYELHD